MITSLEQLDLNKRYTYAEYLTWQFDEMVELIRGKIYKMSPAPNRKHQRASSALQGKIWNYLNDKPCHIYPAPFDVRLPLPPQLIKKDDKVNTVVQPDICVVCDLEKLDDKGCIGAPDWIIEILSISTRKKDLNEKFELYEFSGVKEYWIVDPNNETLLAYYLQENGKYQIRKQTPYFDEKVSPTTFPELTINLPEIFKD